MKPQREIEKRISDQSGKENYIFGRDQDLRHLGKLKLAHLRWMWPYILQHWRTGAIGAVGMIALSFLALPAPYLMKIVIDQAIGGNNLRLLNTVILALFGIQLLMFGASWATNYFFNRFSLEITTRIKKDLFHRILRFPMSFFAQHQTGYIMSRVGEVEGLNLFFSTTLIYVIISIARFVFSLVLLLHLNAKLTAISLLFLPLLFWVSRWFSKDLRQISWKYYEKSAVISTGMQDSLSGIEVVKTFGAESREASKFQIHLNDLKLMNIKKTVLMSLYSESMSFLGAGAGFVILWWSGWNIVSGRFTLGSYLAFMAYFAQLLGPTQMMANLSLTLQPAKVALQRIRELLQIIAEDEHATSKAITSLKGTIEFKDIDFAYEPTKPVFSKANMSIATGEKVLIAGPNGSGKSTLVKLLMGFYRPQQGVILFEGTALHRFSSVSIRERISVVSQNMFLFSDTVRNNVLYSVPEATEKEVKEALRLSGALEFVYAMPRGLDTEVGERGVRLSGGEKQKLSIARAILRKSDLIILDEATTHLDESAVLLLRDLIENQFADNTCIVIAPRPIDIPMINRAFWIEQGSIQEIALSPSVGQGAVLS